MTPRMGSVPAKWVAWCGRMDATHLLAVLDEVNSRGIDHNDQAGVTQVSKDVAFAHEKARKLRRVK